MADVYLMDHGGWDMRAKANAFTTVPKGTSGKRFTRVAADIPISEWLQKYAGNRLHGLACAPRLGDKDTPEGGHNEDYFPSSGMGITRMATNPDKIRG